MSVYSAGIRVSVFALWLTAAFATNAIGADPKVVRTSHEVPAKPAAQAVPAGVQQQKEVAVEATPSRKPPKAAKEQEPQPAAVNEQHPFFE